MIHQEEIKIIIPIIKLMMIMMTNHLRLKEVYIYFYIFYFHFYILFALHILTIFFILFLFFSILSSFLCSVKGNYRVFISGLPNNTKWIELFGFLDKFGVLKSLKIINKKVIIIYYCLF